MHFIEKFDRENIDGQHLRPPVLAILLETIEREKFIASLVPNPSIFSLIKKFCYMICYQHSGHCLLYRAELEKLGHKVLQPESMKT